MRTLTIGRQISIGFAACLLGILLAAVIGSMALGNVASSKDDVIENRWPMAGQTLRLEALFEAGWPGESIAYESLRNRVHVNLARLRSLGLKEVLVRTESGYFLDPRVDLIA